MNIYWFQRTPTFNFKELSERLEISGFTGILFPYSSSGCDYFIDIANSIDAKAKIKYMVAVRPYAITLQQLVKIKVSMNKISRNRILINFVTGNISDEEKTISTIVGDVNDLSSNIERLNYMDKYLTKLKEIKDMLPQFYVSCTNNFTFELAKDNKVIVPYSWYKTKKFDLQPQNSMVYVMAVIRKNKKELDSLDRSNLLQDTEFFTENEFKDFILSLKQDNFDGILIANNFSDLETGSILKVMQEIKEESVR